MLVINKRSPAPAGSVVYIGRPSVLGNPFAMRSESERGVVIEKYREWLREQYRAKGAVYNALHSLAARAKHGEQLLLQCWCAPLACHGDVIADAIAGINTEVICLD
jgi:hypothetical protein